jgi:hypothetical protein
VNKQGGETGERGELVEKSALATRRIEAASGEQRGVGERSMKANHRWLKQMAKLGCLLMMGASMSACGSSSQKWKEEVQLSDGRIIVIDRETVHERGGDEWASNRSGTKPKEYRIRFTQPEGSEQVIEWRTKKEFETWPEIPLVFDVESGEPTIFSLVAVSNGCEIYSKYVYRSGAWTEQSLSEQFGQRTTNLFFGDGNNMPPVVNLEEKRKRNSGSGYRQALKQIGPTRKVCG